MRSFWSGSISFGLVNIPVNVYPAAKAEQLAFRFLHEKDLGRIHNERVCDKCGETIAYENVIRGFEYEKDRYAPVTKEDFESAVPEASKTIDILDFVNDREIDPMFFDKPYYLVPEKKGEKAYVLLREALKKTGKVGIAKVVFHTREHLASVRAKDGGLALEVMHFVSDLKKPKDIGLPENGAKPVKKELEMAEELIENMATRFDPAKYHDDYREHLARLIEDKLHGKQVKMPVQKKTPENVIDIMSKLKASLARHGRKAPKTQKRRQGPPAHAHSTRLDGKDRRNEPLSERRESLRKLMRHKNTGPLRFSEAITQDHAAVFREACRQGLEGIVSKKKDAPYRSGRSDDWLKTKCHKEQEFVIAGFTDPQRSRSSFGALLLAVREKGKLRYAGMVGTGFAYQVAISIEQDDPDRYVTVMTKSKRSGKIFLDYLRNNRGATAVAPYSTRARPSAPVAVPVFWEELTPHLKPDQFNVKNVRARLKSQKKDPWAEFFSLNQPLKKLKAVA